MQVGQSPGPSAAFSLDGGPAVWYYFSGYTQPVLRYYFSKSLHIQKEVIFMDQIFDVLILGGGPAGLSAGLYAGRALLSTLIIESGQEGGQIATTDELENYPGGPAGDTGPALSARMAEQAAQFGAQRVKDTVTAVRLEGPVKELTGAGGTVYRGRTVIIATGAAPRPIGCPGEDTFRGRGVSYCATCDGNFFTGLEVYVVGGGDSAVQEAIYLTRFARKVTVIHRRDTLRAAKSLADKAMNHPKIEFMWDSAVESLSGAGLLNTMEVKNLKTGQVTTVTADPADGVFGLFVFIGYDPATALFDGVLDMEGGYLKTDETMATSLPGVFAAGDVRVKPLRQVVTAAADGAVAAVSAERYLEK